MSGKIAMGKKGGNFLTETVSFIKKEVGSVEQKLEDKARTIAISSAIFGTAVGIVLGIIGTALFQKYVTPVSPAAPQALTPPRI